jgi:hypothetical protein
MDVQEQDGIDLPLAEREEVQTDQFLIDCLVIISCIGALISLLTIFYVGKLS